MKTKYDWSNVSKCVKYLAMDQDGWVFGYDSIPTMFETCFEGDYVHYLLKPHEHGFTGHWQDSLEERPK